MAVATLGNPSNSASTLNQPFPGFIAPGTFRDGRAVIQDLILSLVTEEKCGNSLSFVWVNHHDSHLGCALGANEFEDSPLFSFDGSGDGESGAIAKVASGKAHYDVLARVPAVDSLGGLYSAVTKRYNFKVSQHEGKITGLAAYGSHSGAYDVLKSHLQVSEGVPQVKYIKNLKAKLSVRALRQFGLARKSLITVDEIVQIASSRTVNYPDLAFAVQKVLEETMLEVIEFWVAGSGINNVSLAGGVFANVKLNQRIAELETVEHVNVFPNMGDGGIAVGGVWSHLSKINQLSTSALYQNMYLAPSESDDFNITSSGLNVSNFSDTEAHAKSIAQEISEGLLVAVHQGSMEFGPRALGNRSLVLDARNREIIDRTNKRLNRTEFMPFAPIVLKERFVDYFDTANRSLQPFEYMTMTCDVIPGMRDEIPAVTHVDGTARPQIVSLESNPFLYQIMTEYQSITGCGVLVNTSLNMHEEPINYNLDDSVRALKLGGIDVIHTELSRISIPR